MATTAMVPDAATTPAAIAMSAVGLGPAPAGQPEAAGFDRMKTGGVSVA